MTSRPHPLQQWAPQPGGLCLEQEYRFPSRRVVHMALRWVQDDDCRWARILRTPKITPEIKKAIRSCRWGYLRQPLRDAFQAHNVQEAATTLSGRWEACTRFHCPQDADTGNMSGRECQDTLDQTLPQCQLRRRTSAHRWASSSLETQRS